MGECEQVFNALREAFRQASQQGHVVMVTTFSNACPGTAINEPGRAGNSPGDSGLEPGRTGNSPRAIVPVSDAHWEHFQHGADIGVRGIGRTKAAAFEQAALALTAVIVEPAIVNDRTSIEIECAAPDDQLLLVDWLNALVFEMATRRMLFGRFNVQLETGRLRARVWGEPVEVTRHQPTVEVKGATFTAATVAQTDDGNWIAQCVVDV